MFVRLRQKASRACFCLNRREGTYLVGKYELLYTKNMFNHWVILSLLFCRSVTAPYHKLKVEFCYMLLYFVITSMIFHVLIGLYLLVKLLFTTNVVAQFFLLDMFLDGFFSMWGIEAIYSLSWENGMKESRRFPRVTMCDCPVRQLQNVQVL